MCKNLLSTTVTISVLLFPAIALSRPMQETLNESVIFMGRKCSIEFQFDGNVYKKNCDRLVITGGDRQGDVNFHFDNAEEGGFSFIINPQGKKVMEDNYLLFGQHKTFATFIWTQDDGFIEESFIRGEGACHISRSKVLCMLKTGNDFRADAYFEF